MKNTFFLVLIFLFIIGCAGTKNAIKKSFSTEEVKLIMNGDSLKPMRVYKITSKTASLLLRTKSSYIKPSPKNTIL